MKNKCFIIIGLLLMFTKSFPNSSQLNVSLIANTLSKLKYAVNNNDFPSLSNFLADDYMYENIKSPMAITVLKQVIAQFPQIDSINVNESIIKRERIQLNVNLYTEKGISEKEIILDKNYRILQADIANIAIAGHGSEQGILEQNKGESRESLAGKVMPFWLSETGHIVVDAKVNGKKGNYVVDSGTSAYLMVNSEYDAYNSEKLERKPLGVSGTMDNAGKIKIESFEWNGIQLDNIEAISANIDHLGEKMKIPSFAGTIGYGFLQNYVVEYDYENNQLILWENASSIKEKYKIGKSQIIPMTMAYHIPIIIGKVGNKEIRFGLDCGAQGNMLEQKWEEELRENYNNLKKEILVGAENKGVSSTKVSMNNLNIMGNEYEMDFIFGNLFGGAHEVTLLDGLLGYPFLSYQKTAINFKDNELYFLE